MNSINKNNSLVNIDKSIDTHNNNLNEKQTLDKFANKTKVSEIFDETINQKLNNDSHSIENIEKTPKNQYSETLEKIPVAVTNPFFAGIIFQVGILVSGVLGKKMNEAALGSFVQTVTNETSNPSSTKQAQLATFAKTTEKQVKELNGIIEKHIIDCKKNNTEAYKNLQKELNKLTNDYEKYVQDKNKESEYIVKRSLIRFIKCTASVIGVDLRNTNEIDEEKFGKWKKQAEKTTENLAKKLENRLETRNLQFRAETQKFTQSIQKNIDQAKFEFETEPQPSQIETSLELTAKATMYTLVGEFVKAGMATLCVAISRSNPVTGVATELAGAIATSVLETEMTPASTALKVTQDEGTFNVVEDKELVNTTRIANAMLSLGILAGIGLFSPSFLVSLGVSTISSVALNKWNPVDTQPEDMKEMVKFLHQLPNDITKESYDKLFKAIIETIPQEEFKEKALSKHNEANSSKETKASPLTLKLEVESNEEKLKKQQLLVLIGITGCIFFAWVQSKQQKQKDVNAPPHKENQSTKADFPDVVPMESDSSAQEPDFRANTKNETSQTKEDPISDTIKELIKLKIVPADPQPIQTDQKISSFVYKIDSSSPDLMDRGLKMIILKKFHNEISKIGNRKKGEVKEGSDPVKASFKEISLKQGDVKKLREEYIKNYPDFSTEIKEATNVLLRKLGDEKTSIKKKLSEAKKEWNYETWKEESKKRDLLFKTTTRMINTVEKQPLKIAKKEMTKLTPNLAELTDRRKKSIFATQKSARSRIAVKRSHRSLRTFSIKRI